MNIETLCVHSPNEDKIAHAYGAMTIPIFQTATFSHPGVGESTGYDYSRQSNPTRTELRRVYPHLKVLMIRSLHPQEWLPACWYWNFLMQVTISYHRKIYMEEAQDSLILSE